MKIKIKQCIVQIEWTFIIIILISVFSKTFRSYLEIYFLCFCFIVFHEMAHLFTGTLFGKKIRNIKISVCGLNIGFNGYTDYEGKKKTSNLADFLIYSSGPIASYILAVAFRNIKLVYEINMAFFIMNLMPVYPLDGYTIFKIFIRGIKNKEVKSFLLKFITITFFAIFLIIIVISVIKYKNYNCVIFMLYIFSLNLNK